MTTANQSCAPTLAEIKGEITDAELGKVAGRFGQLRRTSTSGNRTAATSSSGS